MPTVPLYIPVNVARQVAARWQLDPGENDFLELVRSLCSEKLEQVAGIEHSPTGFKPDCSWARLHRTGYRCRSCGGSS
jgi:hypothetical protein